MKKYFLVILFFCASYGLAKSQDYLGIRDSVCLKNYSLSNVDARWKDYSLTQIDPTGKYLYVCTRFYLFKLAVDTPVIVHYKKLEYPYKGRVSFEMAMSPKSEVMIIIADRSTNQKIDDETNHKLFIFDQNLSLLHKQNVVGDIFPYAQMFNFFTYFQGKIKIYRSFQDYRCDVVNNVFFYHNNRAFVLDWLTGKEYELVSTKRGEKTVSIIKQEQNIVFANEQEYPISRIAIHNDYLYIYTDHKKDTNYYGLKIGSNQVDTFSNSSFRSPLLLKANQKMFYDYTGADCFYFYRDLNKE